MTLSDLKSLVGHAVSPPVSPETADQKFVRMCRMAAERLVTSGRWDGSVVTLELTVPDDGILELPDGYAAILGIQNADGRAVDVWSEAIEFLPGGIGHVGDDHQGMGYVIDRGGTPSGASPVSGSPVISEDPPDNPVAGMRWIKESTGVEYTYIDGQWAEL